MDILIWTRLTWVKSCFGGLVLGSSNFLLLRQLPQNKNHRFLLSFSKCYHFGPAKSDHIISHTKKGNNWLDLLQCDLYSETVGCLLVQIPPPTLNFS